MWIVVSYKKHEEQLFKNELRKKFGNDTSFYSPKAIITKVIKNSFKKVEKKLINNYLLCFNEKFKDNYFLNIIKTTKGLKYLLPGSFCNQKNIINFLTFCKKNEDKRGYIKFDFFKDIFIKNKENFFLKLFPNLNYKFIEDKNSINFIINGKLVKIKNKNNLVFNSL